MTDKHAQTNTNNLNNGNDKYIHAEGFVAGNLLPASQSQLRWGSWDGAPHICLTVYPPHLTDSEYSVILLIIMLRSSPLNSTVSFNLWCPPSSDNDSLSLFLFTFLEQFQKEQLAPDRLIPHSIEASSLDWSLIQQTESWTGALGFTFRTSNWVSRYSLRPEGLLCNYTVVSYMWTLHVTAVENYTSIDVLYYCPLLFYSGYAIIAGVSYL